MTEPKGLHNLSGTIPSFIGILDNLELFLNFLILCFYWIKNIYKFILCVCGLSVHTPYAHKPEDSPLNSVFRAASILFLPYRVHQAS